MIDESALPPEMKAFLDRLPTEVRNLIVDQATEIAKRRLAALGVNSPTRVNKRVYYGLLFRDGKIVVACHGTDKYDVRERLILDHVGASPWHVADPTDPDGGMATGRWLKNLGFEWSGEGLPPKPVVDVMNEMARIAETY